jgi:hypothetical protein
MLMVCVDGCRVRIKQTRVGGFVGQEETSSLLRVAKNVSAMVLSQQTPVDPRPGDPGVGASLPESQRDVCPPWSE